MEKKFRFLKNLENDYEYKHAILKSNLLDNDRIVDVNGFEPGGKGVLASKVIDSCKSGKLIVKVP
jgi:hypothetical protein